MSHRILFEGKLDGIYDLRSQVGRFVQTPALSHCAAVTCLVGVRAEPSVK